MDEDKQAQQTSAEEPQNQEEQTSEVSPQEELQKEIDEIFEVGTKGNLEEDKESQEEDKEEQKQESEESKEKLQEEEQNKEEDKGGEKEGKDKEEGKEEEKEGEKEEEKDKEEKPKDKELSSKEQELLEKYRLTKFKSVEDALQAYKNLESAYTKAQQLLSSYQKGIIPEDVKEGVEGAANIIKQPRVDINPPNPDEYIVDGKFDVANYLKDALTEYTLSLQKSLVFGPLASALYTVQKAAVSDVYNQLNSTMEQERQAREIQNALLEEFPVLGENDDLAQKVARAITGEAQLKGEPLTKEEILSLAGEVVKLYNSSQEKKQEESNKVVEPVKGNPPLSGEGKPKKVDKYEQAVDEIFEAALSAQKSSLF